MMNIEQTKLPDNATEVLALSGRLDTASAPLLERKIKQVGDNITNLILDFAGLDYISSMGLRVLLQGKKSFKENGRKFSIQNMGDSIREVFEMTGFLNLMIQEERFVAIRKDEPNSIVLSLIGQMLMEDVEAVSKELREIREQKSYRQITKDLVMTEDVSKILEQGPRSTGTFTVILDMEKLSYFSPDVSKRLKQAIVDSVWDKRVLKIQNASEEVLAELRKEGLGRFIG